MKKLIFFLNLALACSFFHTTRPNGNLNYDLIEAIDNVNLEKVEKLLNKQSNISQEQKEKLLVAISQTIKICKKSTKSLSASKIDLLRFLIGLTCISIGLPSTAIGVLLLTCGRFFQKSQFVRNVIAELTNSPEMREKMAEEMSKSGKSREEIQAELQALMGRSFYVTGIPCTLFGLAVSWLGVNQTRKGWKMFSARTRLKKARKIQEILEKHFGKISAKPVKSEVMQKKAS